MPVVVVVVLVAGVVILSVPILLAQCNRLCPLECGPSGKLCCGCQGNWVLVVSLNLTLGPL